MVHEPAASSRLAKTRMEISRANLRSCIILKVETNRDQNKQFEDAVREIEKQIGRQLDEDDEEQLHREISKKGYTYWDIVDLGVVLFGN